MTASKLALEDLHEIVSVRFEEVQTSLANHRKNCVALYKTHVQAGKITQPKKNGEAKLLGEIAFGDVFIDMVNRVLVIKKGPCADRVVKFVGSYVKFVNDKVLEERQKQASSSSASPPKDDDDESLASRFVSRLLQWVLQGFEAKNKIVRQRTAHIVSEMISHIGEIDGDTYDILRDSLISRICDKETIIRAHAVIALSKLVGTEDPSEIESGEKTILELILEVCCYDPAAEVRRAALLNVPLTPETIDLILSRTRDTDPLTRKLIYASILQTKLGHPRQLTITQREDVVKTGLGDREPAVRAAAAKLLASWFDIALSEVSDGDKEVGVSWKGDDGGVMRSFIRFLGLFDVVGPGEVAAVEAVLSVFASRPSICDVFVFEEEYWNNLIPESAVLARVFVEYCLNAQKQNSLETSALPVVTAFAFHIQEAYNALVRLMQEADLLGALDEQEDEDEAREEEMAKREVILGELLRMAMKLDYGDEIGRRKVFSVVKDMLAHPQLPPGLINHSLDVLREILPSERELIRVVVEVVIELRDDDEEAEGDENQDDSRSIDTTIRKERSMARAKNVQEMTPDEKREADLIDMRCLTICIGMLERVHGSFEDNSTLEGILADLIIPAVKRKELAMREKGLVGLGLCCLIARNMALNSFQLFLSQVQSATEELKLKVLQVIFDLLIMYEGDFLGRSEEIAQQILGFLLQTLEAEESNSVQAILCIGLSKLLMSGLVTDIRVLTSLVLTYISPSTSDNPDLRQCLSYFFPVYCYSASENQRRMQSIYMTALDLASRVHEQLDEDQEMISPYQFGLLMLDWTDPHKAAQSSLKGRIVRNVHADLAIDILLALYDSERGDEDQKVLCQLLGQLQLTPELDTRTILKINILLEHHEEQCPFNSPVLDKIMNKFRSRFVKLYSNTLDEIDLGQYRDDEFEQLYESINVEMPDGSGARAAPRREHIAEVEESVFSSVDGDDDATPEAHTPRPSKTRRKPSSTDGDDDVAGDYIPPAHPTLTPMKKGSKRAAASKHVVASPVRKKRQQTKIPQDPTTPERPSHSKTTPPQSDLRRSSRRPKPSLKTSQYTEGLSEEDDDDDDEEEEEDEESNDVPATQKSGRRHVSDDELSSDGSDDLGGYSDQDS